MVKRGKKGRDDFLKYEEKGGLSANYRCGRTRSNLRKYWTIEIWETKI